MAAKFPQPDKIEPMEVDEINEQKNPLLMNVVFDKVCENLQLADLLKCRISCRTFRDNAKLKSLIKDKSAVSLVELTKLPSLTVDSIPDYFQNDTNVYNRYYLEGIAYHKPLINKVFEVLGHKIEILKLHVSSKQMRMPQFRQLLYERVVNLKELQFHNVSLDYIFKRPIFWRTPKEQRPVLVHLTRLEFQEIRYPVVSFMTEFFETLTNLREIILKTDVCGDWSNQTGIWLLRSAIASSVIGGLKKSRAYKTLKEFRCGILTTNHFEDLIHMGNDGMQLEILELHAPPNEMENMCSNFLNTQQSSLKELIFFEQRSSAEASKPPLRLPASMANLEQLQLSKSYKCNVVPLFPINYSEQCPKLKTITFLGYDGYKSVVDNLTTSTSVTSIVLHSRPWENGEEIGKLLSASFVNLTKLNVRYPSGEFLSAVWNSCVQLKDLTLIMFENVNLEGRILGASPLSIERWLRWLKSHPDQSDLMDIVPAPDIAHSIRNLTDLHKFKLIVEYDEKFEEHIISDATAFFGLRKMPQLRYLEFYGSHWMMGLTECHFFSDQCKELLRKDLELAVIHFTPAKSYDTFDEEITGYMVFQ